MQRRRATTSQGLQSPRAQRGRTYGGVFGDDALPAPDDPEHYMQRFPNLVLEDDKTRPGFLRIPEDEIKTKGGIGKDDARPESEGRLPVPPRPPVRRMKSGGVVRPKPKALPASVPKRSSAETKAGSRPKTRPAKGSRRK